MQIHRGTHTYIHVHLSLFTQPGNYCQYDLTPLVLHPRKFDERHQTRGASPLFSWHVNSWGLLCYDSCCHICCVCLCVYGCVLDEILPHLGGSPAVPLLTRLDSVLQTLSCHSGLPGAHLTVRGETLATCASTLPHLPRVCLYVWDWVCLSERVRMCVCVQVRICVCLCLCACDTGYMYILRAEAPVFTPLS